MKKKIYTVHVEDEHICTSFQITASTAAEARLKAKEKFVTAFYDMKKVKTCITNTEKQ